MIPISLFINRAVERKSFERVKENSSLEGAPLRLRNPKGIVVMYGDSWKRGYSFS